MRSTDRRERDEAETLARLAGEHWGTPERRQRLADVALVLGALLALGILLALALHQVRQHPWQSPAGETGR